MNLTSGYIHGHTHTTYITCTAGKQANHTTTTINLTWVHGALRDTKGRKQQIVVVHAVLVLGGTLDDYEPILDHC